MRKHEFTCNLKTIFAMTYTGYFANDNEPGGIENATHNTFPS
jgi:hypothetical protein